jgi:hypothetical protein
VGLSGFDPQRAPPTTVAKKQMIGKSQAAEVQIIMDAFDEGSGPFAKDIGTLEGLRMFLNNETGKSYSKIAASHYLKAAIPGVLNLKQIRSGPGFIRPWAWRDHNKWIVATGIDIANELKN